MNLKLVSILFLVLIVPSAYSASFSTDTGSEWREGDFVLNTEVSEEFLKLESDSQVIDWRNNFTNRLEDAERADGDGIFVAGEDVDDDAHVWSYDSNGNLNWDEKISGFNAFNLIVDSDYVYVSTYDTVYKLDKSDGGVINVFNGRGSVGDMAQTEDKLFVITDNNYTSRIDKESFDEDWQTNNNLKNLQSVEVTQSGRIYLTRRQEADIIEIDGEPGNIINQRSLNGIGVDVKSFKDYIYVTDGADYLFKLSKNLSTKYWDYQELPGTDSEIRDLDIGVNGFIYGITVYDGDDTIKVSPAGNLVWRYEDPESQLGVESYDKGVYSAGKNYPNDYSSNGTLTKFTEIYPNDGEYESKIFGAGGTKFWETLNLTTDLNSETVNVEVVFSNSSSFSSTSTQSFNDITENTTLDLGYEVAEYARVDFRFSTNNQGTTPRIDRLNLTYETNEPPTVDDYYPPNGTKLKPGNFDINVTVSDGNGDDMTVTFYDNDSDQIKSPQTVNGGSGVAEVQHEAQGKGNKLNWYVEVTDDTTTIDRVFYYTTFKDSGPTFSKASPKDNNEVNDYPVNLSIFVEDDFSSSIDIEFKDDNGDTLKTDTVSSGTFVNASYPVLSAGSSYNWTIEATDGKSNTNSSEYKFFYDKKPYRPINARIQTNYSSVISSVGSSTVVPFRITNPSSAKDLNVTVGGSANAKFVDGTEFKRMTMGEGTKTFLVEVKPESSGKKDLSLEIRNLRYGTVTELNKDVYVKEANTNFEGRNVPGIGMLQIFGLTMISTLAYFALL